MMTGGGNNLGSTPTDERALPAVASKFWNLKDAHLDGVRWTRGNVESLVRGWGS